MLLVHESQADRGAGGDPIEEIACLPTTIRPPVAVEHTGQIRQQRRLARPVTAEQCVDLAAPETQRHIVEGSDPGEGLGEVLDVQRAVELPGHPTPHAFVNAAS